MVLYFLYKLITVSGAVLLPFDYYILYTVA
jgi:hypothetical protein